jgi:hypothetical protein
MSDDADWLEALRRIEHEIGRPLSLKERESLDNARPGFERAIARDSSLTFMAWLMARQGTIFPDFDALYRKKAELDKRLLDP